jgi:sugar-specific transcriptional regulator TrmB
VTTHRGCYGATVIEKLVSLGLTSYEAKAYLALVSRGSSTAAETARIAGLPRQRVYDVLGGLVERGLASTRPGKAVKYVATPPEVALELLLNDHRNRVATYERDAAALLDDLKTRYQAGQHQTDPLEYIEVLRDRGAINERFGELQRNIQREILVFTKPPYATPPQDETTGLEVTRNHVVRTVYERSILGQPEMANGVHRFIELGEEARFVDELPLKLVIIDEAIVLFGMEDPIAESDALTLLVIEHPSLAGMLKIGFEAVWQEGETYEEALARQEPPRAAASA